MLQTTLRFVKQFSYDAQTLCRFINSEEFQPFFIGGFVRPCKLYHYLVERHGSEVKDEKKEGTKCCTDELIEGLEQDWDMEGLMH